LTPLERSSIIATETRLIPKSKRKAMSNTATFIVKAYATAIVGFFLVVGVHQLSLIETPAPAPAPAPTVAKVTKVAKPITRHIRKETRPAPSHTYTSHTYTSSHGTSSERLGGSANPFTQVEGFNEEDAVIYGMLKAAGYSDSDSASATMSSVWW
jgi:hypothetical protein